MIFIKFVLVLTLLPGCIVRRTYPDPRPDDAFTIRELQGPVQVQVDDFGVPHISAGNTADALTAMGFLHARDRGFQMEMLRMASQGRLSELFGEPMLELDQRLRILTWKVDNQVANLSGAEKDMLMAYCAGVNRGYAEAPQSLELRLLRRDPAPWTPSDVLTLARLQAWQNATDMHKELLRERVRQVTADAQTQAWLFAPTPAMGTAIAAPDPDQWLPSADLPAPPAGEALLTEPYDARAARRQAALLPSQDDLMVRTLVMVEALNSGPGGSNGMAVSGDRTADGRPILAGDPHLNLTWPNLFYEAHLSAPGLDVSGATIPGMPVVLIGRAAEVAWTLTVSFADSQNLTRLTVEGDRYKADGRWTDLETWPQTFQVRDGEPVTETYRMTDTSMLIEHGWSDSLPPSGVYALHWPLFRDTWGDHVSTYLELYAASTGEAALAAIESLDFAAFSWIFATANGDIGYARGGEMAGDVHRALPGTDPDHGTPPPATAFLNPPLGVIVANNQSIRPEQDRTRYNSGTYRAMRALDVLTGREDWTPQGLRGLQMDIVSLEASLYLPRMLKVVGRPTGLEAEMVSVLSRWDYQMSEDAAAPLIYEAWRAAIQRRLFMPYMADAELREAFLGSRLSEAPFEIALTTDDGQRWWDDPSTPPVETREQVIRAGLAEASRELSDAFGRQPTAWRWDAVLSWQPEHPFASKRILRPIFGVDPVPLSGGRHTLRNFEHYMILSEYRLSFGPVFRQVVVPGGEAGFVLAGGNAGQPRHPFAESQLRDWTHNRQHVAGVASDAGGRLRLEP